MNYKPGLYIIATSIGNMMDMTFRSVDLLKKADVILCEDTRVSLKLLNYYQIFNKKTLVYNDHANYKMRIYVADLIKDGKIICLISDAGTPLISDPGYKLVEYLRSLNLHIDSLPGACSLITALTLTGFATDKFFFAGFIAKQEAFKDILKNNLSTIIFFESANRLLKTLHILDKQIGSSRKICIARELTKFYQDVKIGYAKELIEEYENKIKGEIVLIVAKLEKHIISEQDLDAKIKSMINAGVSKKEIKIEVKKEYKNMFSSSFIYKKIENLTE